MSAGVLVSLHGAGAGAGDMGRVAALAPGTRLLCTDQAALPLGLASLATLPPLLLAAGSLARAFRSQGGRCSHDLGPNQESVAVVRVTWRHPALLLSGLVCHLTVGRSVHCCTRLLLHK